MVALPVGADSVVLEGVGRMEAVDVNQVALLVGDDLVLLARHRDVLVLRDHVLVSDLHRVHGRIPGPQLRVPQVLVIHEVPLAATVIVRVLVALSWEVHPLRMTKLVAHEVEIRLSAERLRNEPDHLVQTHAPGHLNRRVPQSRHSRVDLGIKEPHRNSLVTDDGLIV